MWITLFYFTLLCITYTYLCIRVRDMFHYSKETWEMWCMRLQTCITWICSHFENEVTLLMCWHLNGSFIASFNAYVAFTKLLFMNFIHENIYFINRRADVVSDVFFFGFLLMKVFSIQFCSEFKNQTQDLFRKRCNGRVCCILRGPKSSRKEMISRKREK